MLPTRRIKTSPPIATAAETASTAWLPPNRLPKPTSGGAKRNHTQEKTGPALAVKTRNEYSKREIGARSGSMWTRSMGSHPSIQRWWAAPGPAPKQGRHTLGPAKLQARQPWGPINHWLEWPIEAHSQVRRPSLKIVVKATSGRPPKGQEDRKLGVTAKPQASPKHTPHTPRWPRGCTPRMARRRNTRTPTAAQHGGPFHICGPVRPAHISS